MKKLFLILLILGGRAGLAKAAPLTSICGLLMGPNTSGGTGSVCSVTPDAGFFISSLTLTGSNDITGAIGNPTVTFSATLSQSSSVFAIPTFCGGPISGLPCADTVLPSATVSGLNLAGYTIQLANASNTVSGGTIFGASMFLTVNVIETAITNVPEPETLSLLGTGLIGLGLVQRRQRKSV